jgi:hypothetical protein
MRESAIETAVTRAAERAGWIAYKWRSPNHRGVPDRLFFRAGRVLAVEFKAPGKRPTKLQAYVHRALEQQGFHVHVIDSIEAGKRLLA